jgi:hypothetical protein
VSGVGFEPSDPIRKRFVLRVNTIVCPSGEKAGKRSSAEPEVSGCGVPPAAATLRMSESAGPLRS